MQEIKKCVGEWLIQEAYASYKKRGCSNADGRF